MRILLFCVRLLVKTAILDRARYYDSKIRPYFTQKPDKHPDKRIAFLEVLRSCIDIVDSVACGLRIMMEVFTWTPSILPTKVILEYHECSFSVEFSTSLREKQWRIGE
ncbi:unnamed protein product [Rodentolepis nana]|uniref:HORMA domain-containing protein n=1 Tax=Rodentolepis nana TaxID=102285 RepID=A0A0R3U002_RODNA|nr:unnamed protein product [Rodentolepis nana]